MLPFDLPQPSPPYSMDGISNTQGVIFEPRGLVSALEALSVNSATGSCHDGTLLYKVACGAYTASAPQSCQKTGIHLCSRCRLVKYCSKTCQNAHWAIHKADCKSPYMSTSWTTSWTREGRHPAFITETDEPYLNFGRTFYVWGNLPVVDCMNVSKNEGNSVSKMNLNLAFIASGDLRNMMSTVNGLPNSYKGECRILLNDLNPVVSGRNAAILFILLSDSGLEIEEAAELCVHLQYSAALTREQAAHVFQRITDLFSGGNEDACYKEVSLRGGGTLYLSFDDASAIANMASSRYPLSKAENSMHSIMLAPSRRDYVDRYLFTLRGPHRVAEMRLRKTGILLPFGSPTSHFTEPNRLLFDDSGDWFSPDSASPMAGWDPRQVLETGKKHGCSPDDTAGCLFFHVKQVFIDFAKRAQQFRLDIHVTNEDAMMLPELIEQRQGYLRQFSPPTFDRIETSNVMDYVEVHQLVNAWAPMINRLNKHATLLLSTMNWHLWRDDAQAAHLMSNGGNPRPLLQRCALYLNLDLQTVITTRTSDASDPRFMSILNNLDPFYDNSRSFKDYCTHKLDLSGVAKRNGLIMRSTNSVIPRGVGWPMSTVPKVMPPYPKDDWYLLCCLGKVHGHERYLELGVAQ